ncbi:MAG TPA: hypothetical protein VEQ58_09440 [Polyangiaceae bacterium]|nr:hypothetical protein [Polyangiaceae bacterium]
MLSASATAIASSPPVASRYGCAVYDTNPYYLRFWPEQARRTNRAACELNLELSRFVSERNRCSDSADCTTVWSFCPFGCGLAVSRAQAAAVADKYAELRSKYGALHDDDCQQRCLPTISARCEAGRCEAVSGDAERR